MPVINAVQNHEAVELTFPASDPIAIQHAYLSARQRERAASVAL